jgi:outer membrane protein OmpA-like peptidoglycan-associated protein
MKTNKLFKPLALAAICAALFAGCASTGTNETLESARAEVNAAASNPDVLAKAPLELKTAREALDRADAAQRAKEDRAEVDHQAYLAQTRARTAQDFAIARRATDDLTETQHDVDRMRLAMRTREADAARAQAAQSSQAADIARAQAAQSSMNAAQSAQQAQIARAQTEAANRQAAAAAQQTGVAQLMAESERQKAAQATQDAMSAEERVRMLQMKIAEVEARETERGLLVTLGDVLFQSGRAELQPVAAPRLDKLASFLQQFPEKKLLIEGYTDSIGAHQTNMELSQRRAEAVKAALAVRGVDPSRMTIGGYGESFPVATNQTMDGRQLNRRVEVVVSDDKGNLKSRLTMR